MSIYYIDPAGNDTTGDGSSGSPWATVSKANTETTTGDTVILKDGTYTISTINLSNSVTWQAENNNLAILDGAGAEVRIKFVADTEMIGINFTNIVNSTLAVFERQSTGITVTFTNCKIYDIVISPDRGDALFTFTVANLTFTSCLIYNISTTTYTSTCSMFYMSNGSNHTFNNCVIHQNNSGNANIYSFFEALVSTVYVNMKNTIILNDGDTMTLFKGYAGGDFTKDLTYSDFYGTGLSAQAGTGNITSDPLFVDPPNSDFRLRQSSPCLDTGTII